MRLRVSGVLLVLALAVAMPGASASAAPSAPTLADSIAAGVNRGSTGFGQSSLVVPVGTYVTYLIQTDPALAGKPLEIWTRGASGEWTMRTTRTVAADGTMHYYARVDATTSFQAKWSGDDTHPASAAHGRTAAASATGDTRLVVTCDEFGAAQSATSGKAVMVREVWIKVGRSVTMSLCSNASTGFAWGAATYDRRALVLTKHWVTPLKSALPGAPRIENWAFSPLNAATSTVSIEYSRPWTGGEKAVWTISLKVHGLR